MNKVRYIPLFISATVGTAAFAADDTQTEELPTIEVVGQRLNNVSVTEVKSADLAEALTKKIAGISLVRRSGIANDIILRGQKKDNINILFDHSKIYGACPNRMDPPTSHILITNIDEIEVTEGPYDVENFGTLSGAVNISSKKPEVGFHGDINLNLGSWDYQKFAATLNGGSETVRAMFSFSQETGGQYEDGDGNDFAQQIELNAPAVNYKPEYQDMDAYEKTTLMAKVYMDIAENQNLEFSITANRSDDVLYPSSKMDAIYDDSDVINLDYKITDISEYSKELNFQFYKTSVEHPMSTFYRLTSGPDSANELISYLETDMQGMKLINAMDLSSASELTVGIDLSTRNWDGAYEGYGMASFKTGAKNIPDVETKNKALFVELKQENTDFSMKYGARFDDTSITAAASTLASKDYTAFSAYVFSTYNLDEKRHLFGGVGRSSRVPDPKELYFLMAPMNSAMPAMQMQVGNPDLDDTTNTEIDFGIEHKVDGYSMKAKLFYSQLTDFIHFNASKMSMKYDNVDATIYGLDVSGAYEATANITVDFGLAYQRGKKDEALNGQTDTNLAEIPPMKVNLAASYAYGKNNTAMLEMVAADSWSNFDDDNGEQELDSWSVLNLKVVHHFTEQLGLTVGIDNLLDETYAVSNTYNDLSLLPDGTGEVMLMNEPGRYVYLNAVYSF